MAAAVMLTDDLQKTSVADIQMTQILSLGVAYWEIL